MGTIEYYNHDICSFDTKEIPAAQAPAAESKVTPGAPDAVSPLPSVRKTGNEAAIPTGYQRTIPASDFQPFNHETLTAGSAPAAPHERKKAASASPVPLMPSASRFIDARSTPADARWQALDKALEALLPRDVEVGVARSHVAFRTLGNPRPDDKEKWRVAETNYAVEMDKFVLVIKNSPFDIADIRRHFADRGLQVDNLLNVASDLLILGN